MLDKILNYLRKVYNINTNLGLILETESDEDRNNREFSDWLII